DWPQSVRPSTFGSRRKNARPSFPRASAAPPFWPSTTASNCRKRWWIGRFRKGPCPLRFAPLPRAKSHGRLRAMRTPGQKFALFAAPLALAVAFLPACAESGGGSGGGRVANVKAGEMPSDGSWNGVYFNPQYGNLHLIETGSSIAGKWKRTDGSAW